MERGWRNDATEEFFSPSRLGTKNISFLSLLRRATTSFGMEICLREGLKEAVSSGPAGTVVIFDSSGGGGVPAATEREVKLRAREWVLLGL